MSQIDFEHWFVVVMWIGFAVALVDKLFGLGLFSWEGTFD
jgi:hypothetical protein